MASGNALGRFFAVHSGGSIAGLSECPINFSATEFPRKCKRWLSVYEDEGRKESVGRALKGDFVFMVQESERMLFMKFVVEEGSDSL